MAVQGSSDLHKLLRRTFLFSGSAEVQLRYLLSHDGTTREHFVSGRMIYSPESFQCSIGVIISGSAGVWRPAQNGRRVMMSILQRGQIFGAVTLFGSQSRFVTEVQAETDCELLFISRDCIRALLHRDPALAERYIAYLTERIFFLNRKIDGFAGATAKTKLAAYLADNAGQVDGRWTVCLPYNMKDLAEYLNMGRASLYRAMDSLSTDGLIQREGNTVTIHDIDEINQL